MSLSITWGFQQALPPDGRLRDSSAGYIKMPLRRGAERVHLGENFSKLRVSTRPMGVNVDGGRGRHPTLRPKKAACMPSDAPYLSLVFRHPGGRGRPGICRIKGAALRSDSVAGRGPRRFP